MFYFTHTKPSTNTWYTLQFTLNNDHLILDLLNDKKEVIKQIECKDNSMFKGTIGIRIDYSNTIIKDWNCKDIL